MPKYPDDREVKVLILIGDRPATIPTDWPILNAPRPLCGDELWTGGWGHGRFYAALNPTDRYFDSNLCDNVQDDAYLVRWVTEDEMRAEVRAYAEANGYLAELDGLDVNDYRMTFEHITKDAKTTVGAIRRGDLGGKP